jgi:glycosyltransferase involved in cell wall biosynthesis
MESWGVRKPIKVIENGVEINNHLDVQQTRGVCVISRLVSWKNIDIVIKACEKAKVNCTIVGDGPEMERLKIIAASSKTKVEFMGKLDSKGVQNILYSSEIYILFSSYEGLSFSLLEAMAAKKAIIVSDVEGNRQVITNEKNGLIVTVGNLEKLTSAIKNLSDNPTIRKTLGENAETTVRMKYSNSIQIGKILELIK